MRTASSMSTPACRLRRCRNKELHEGVNGMFWDRISSHINAGTRMMELLV